MSVAAGDCTRLFILAYINHNSMAINFKDGVILGRNAFGRSVVHLADLGG